MQCLSGMGPQRRQKNELFSQYPVSRQSYLVIKKSMTDKQAFGQAWVAAWNSHDIDEIMSHYAEDIEFHSPVVQRLNNEPSGKLVGKTALRAYFLRGLAAYPDLHFELYHILEGVDSVVLYYKSINNSLSAEMMVLNGQGLVKEVRAHYKQQQ